MSQATSKSIIGSTPNNNDTLCFSLVMAWAWSWPLQASYAIGQACRFLQRGARARTWNRSDYLSNELPHQSTSKESPPTGSADEILWPRRKFNRKSWHVNAFHYNGPFWIYEFERNLIKRIIDRQFSAVNLALAGFPLTNALGENMPSRH